MALHSAGELKNPSSWGSGGGADRFVVDASLLGFLTARPSVRAPSSMHLIFPPLLSELMDRGAADDPDAIETLLQIMRRAYPPLKRYGRRRVGVLRERLEEFRVREKVSAEAGGSELASRLSFEWSAVPGIPPIEAESGYVKTIQEMVVSALHLDIPFFSFDTALPFEAGRRVVTQMAPANDESEWVWTSSSRRSSGGSSPSVGLLRWDHNPLYYKKRLAMSIAQWIGITDGQLRDRVLVGLVFLQIFDFIHNGPPAEPLDIDDFERFVVGIVDP